MAMRLRAAPAQTGVDAVWTRPILRTTGAQPGAPGPQALEWLPNLPEGRGLGPRRGPARLLCPNRPRGNAISILELNQASLHDSARGHSRRVTAALNLA